MTGDVRGGAWLKLPARITDMLEAVPLDASGVYLELSAFAAKKDTRGRVGWDDLHVAVRRKVTYARASKLVGDLAAHGIVTVDDTAIDLGDTWRDENPSGEIWHDPVQRERWARDKRLKRDSELCRRIKARDRNLCRYCGIRVNWADKVSPRGGTYDHVDPDKDNEFSNVVVACRRCNGRKRDRTPEQWIDEDPAGGLTLLRAGTTAETAARQTARAGPNRANPRSTPGQPDNAPRARDRTGPTRGQPDTLQPGTALTRPDPHGAAEGGTQPPPEET